MLALVLAALVAQAAPADAGQPQAGGGRITGKITIAGLAPRLANLPVTRDLKYCGTSKPDEAMEVGKGGGIKNAVVWVTDVPAGKPPAQPLKLDQKGCAFEPHVLAAPVGATIQVINDDPLLHNVRATEGASLVFNYAMPIQGQVVPTKLKKPGFIKLSCDVHPWMKGWIAALPNAAFAVTDANGDYTIEGVPPGKHHVKVWQERLGEHEGDVEVTAAAPAKFDVTLNPR